MKDLKDLNHYTYGYVFGGIAIFSVATISLFISFIPIIWIGGFIVGGSMFFKGLSNFSVANSINTRKTINEAIALLNQAKPHESLRKVNSLKNNSKITPDGRIHLKELRDECLIAIDNQNFNGLITETENLLNANHLDKVLENIDKMKNIAQISDATKFHLESLLARCTAKKNDYSLALQQISLLMNNNEYSAPVEDYIFKTYCEINLKKFDLAEKTMFSARSKFPTSRTLDSYQRQIRPILYANT